MIRWDPEEVFFSDGSNEKKSEIFYSSIKDKIPNALIGTAFKKHMQEITNECSVETYSKVFFYLPSTTDRRESINHYMENVNVNPINCWYESFKDYSPTEEDFLPNL